MKVEVIEMRFDVIKLNSCYDELGLVPITKLPKLAQKLLSVTELDETSIVHIHKNGKYDWDQVNDKVIKLYKFNNFMTDINNFNKFSESDTGYVIFRMTVEKSPDGSYTLPSIKGGGSLLYIPTATVIKGNVTKEVPIEPVERTFVINAIDPHSNAMHDLLIKIKGDKKEIFDADTNQKVHNINFSERLRKCFSNNSMIESQIEGIEINERILNSLIILQYLLI
jgi:hypothetical protein